MLTSEPRTKKSKLNSILRWCTERSNQCWLSFSKYVETGPLEFGVALVHTDSPAALYVYNKLSGASCQLWYTWPRRLG